MKLSNVLQRIAVVIKEYIDKVMPTKLSDLEIDMELGAVKTINGNEPDENGNVEIETGSPNTILFTEQILTDEQKIQAKKNIDAKPNDLRVNIASSFDFETNKIKYACDTPFADMKKAYESGAIVLFSIGGYEAGLGAYLKDVPISSTETECKIIVEKDSEIYTGIMHETFIIREDDNVQYSYKNLIAADVIKNETGTSAIPMSQKATTDALALKADKEDIVQSDWNQNDETASDYIKNRTHYKTGSISTILDGTFEGFALVDGVYGVQINPIPEFIYGEKYKVTWDGVEYEVVGDVGDASTYVGFDPRHPSLYDYPFSIACIGSTIYLILSKTDETSHTVKLVYDTEVIHKLDEEYIPDTIARVSDIDERFEEITADEVDAIFAEIFG